jgi:hypothetical protein
MRQTTDYGKDDNFFSEVLLIWFGGSVGRWVGGLETKAKKQNSSEGWWVNGLVGWWVGGLVGGMSKKNWYWAHTG